MKRDEKRAEKNQSCWRVTIPSDFSETGKRRNIYFPSREEATRYANNLKRRRQAFGSSVAHITAAMAEEWEECVKLLLPYGLDLFEVVKAYSGMIEELGGDSQEVQSCFRLGLNLKRQAERSVTWKEAVKELFVLREEVQKRKPHTIAQIKHITNRVERLRPDFVEKMLCYITGDDCREMIAECFTTPKQRDNARRVLSGIFTYGIKRDWCKDNPMKKLDPIVQQEKEIRALTPRQVRALFEAAPEDCIPALALMTFAGIRPEEVTRLTWEDVDFSERVVSVRGISSKTGGTRHVTMPLNLVSWLLQHRPQKAELICPANWRRKWTWLRKKAGWDTRNNPWPADSLRHTYASYHAKKFRDFPMLQMEMGHRSAQLLRQRYTNLSGVTESAAKEFWSITPRNE